MDTKNFGLKGVGTKIQLGKGGPHLKDNAGALESRNAADNALVVMRGAAPVGQDDFVTKRYLETRAGASVTGQIDGGSPPAAGTAGRLFICTTAGGTYDEGYLYYDTGAAWDEIVPFEGMTIAVTDALSGGNITFLADHVYIWDEDGTEWKDLGASPTVDGVVKSDRASLVYTDSFGSPILLSTVPANAVVTKVSINVTQAWNSGVDLIVGDAGDTDRLVAASDVDMQTVGVYVIPTHHMYGSETSVNFSVSGTPTVGAAQIVIQYDIP